MSDIKTIKIKKLQTGIVLTGIVENNKITERFVKPDEVVMVLDIVPEKLDALKEGYVVVKDSGPSSQGSSTSFKKSIPPGDGGKV